MLSHGSTLTHRKKFATLSGGCAPEASTLPPVTVSRIFYNGPGPTKAFVVKDQQPSYG